MDLTDFHFSVPSQVTCQYFVYVFFLLHSVTAERSVAKNIPSARPPPSSSFPLWPTTTTDLQTTDFLSHKARHHNVTRWQTALLYNCTHMAAASCGSGEWHSRKKSFEIPLVGTELRRPLKRENVRTASPARSTLGLAHAPHLARLATRLGGPWVCLGQLRTRIFGTQNGHETLASLFSSRQKSIRNYVKTG